MVHGGGHHHHPVNTGGSSFVPGNRSETGGFHQQQNIFVVNQQPHGFWYPYYQQSQQQPLSSLWWRGITPEQHDRDSVSSESTSPRDGDNDCERCCRRCCLALGTWWFCCRWFCCRRTPIYHSKNALTTVGPSDHSSLVGKLVFPILLSLLLFVILLGASTCQHSWTLNAGETRRINRPMLVRQMTVTSNGGNVGALVYNAGERCPPLTGPTVTLDDTLQFHLAQYDYQYDYFTLNAGSSIHLDIVQSTGSTFVYILKGEHMLKRVQGDDDGDDRGGFHKHAIFKRFVTAGNQGHISFEYQVVKQSNVYLIVYENMSNDPGDLQVHYTVTATTHNVQDLEPICSNPSSCSFLLPTFWKQACWIVQATSTKKDTPMTAQEIVSITVTGERSWWLVSLFSSLPLFLIVLHCSWQCCLSQQPNQWYETIADQSADGPVLPTAPVEAVAQVVTAAEYGSDRVLMIPVENVIPIPPPPMTVPRSKE